MSEIKLISPMLDHFILGEPFRDCGGVRTCPAMDEETGKKYIVKIISTPATAAQLDALLLTGAYKDKADALVYFKEITDGIVDEVSVLQRLSELEGFMPFDGCQVVPMDDDSGFDVYLLSTYKYSLERTFRKDSMTHLGALNLGLDMCAALTACRRSGYLYIDLKPDNIYLTTDNGFRIGDLGFIRLDSLKYASLPDRYRSTYTAPEIKDAFSSLNTTMDVFAAGLILYQAFNGGILPNIDPDQPLPPPDYADYEMAEIILKACSYAPEDRWSDPVEMGQALVSYMQRNGAHDTPIVPPTVIETETPACAVADPEISVADESQEEDVSEPTDELESPADALLTETDEAPVNAPVYTEDNLGNLTFIADSDEDETLPGMDSEDMEFEQVSVEVSDILSRADAILAHPTPDPVIPPEPIDVPIPDPLPIITEESTPDTEVAVQTVIEDPALNNSESDVTVAVTDAPEETYDPEEDIAEEAPRKRRKPWLVILIIAAAIVALLVAAFFYYKNIYLQLVDSIVLDGEKTQLTVQVNSEINEELLTVVCVDTYGNQIPAPVVGGKAVFTDLAPDSAYTVKVLIKGFHRLTGDTTTAYSTPVQTSISNLTAVTGQEDCSAVVSFTVDGPDAAQWKVAYNTGSEAAKEVIFTGHMIEIPGLSEGNAYDFVLTPMENLFFTGETKVSHVASKCVVADNLLVTEMLGGKLTVAWSAPEGASVSGWTVRCYNDKGYDKTVTATDTTATFTGITQADPYTVDVTASGMSKSQRVTVPENSVSVSQMKCTLEGNTKATLSWTTNTTSQDCKLVLLYSADNSTTRELSVTGNSATVSPLIPGANYEFTLKVKDGNPVIGGSATCTTVDAKAFDDYGIKKAHILLKMCKTPSNANWSYKSLTSSDYTTTFKAGEKASFVIRLQDDYSTTTQSVTTMFVIRDSAGNVVNTATQTASWRSMWSYGYGEFDLPALPGTAGTYTVSVYFNGALAGTQNFTIK